MVVTNGKLKLIGCATDIGCVGDRDGGVNRDHLPLIAMTVPMFLTIRLHRIAPTEYAALLCAGDQPPLSGDASVIGNPQLWLDPHERSNVQTRSAKDNLLTHLGREAKRLPRQLTGEGGRLRTLFARIFAQSGPGRGGKSTAIHRHLDVTVRTGRARGERERLVLAVSFP